MMQKVLHQDIENLFSFRKAKLVFTLILLVSLMGMKTGLAVDYNNYVDLVENTDNCFIDCYAILRIHDLPIDVQIDDINKMKLRYIKTQLSNELESLKFQIRVNQSYVETYYENECSPYEDSNVNGTFEVNNCSRVEKQREAWRYVYNNFSPLGKTIKANTEYFIKIVGKKDPKIGENNIDWLMTFDNHEFEQWAWWNSSFEFRREIGLPKIVVPINGTNPFLNEAWIYGLNETDISTIYYNDVNDTRIANDTTEYYKATGFPIPEIRGTFPPDMIAFYPMDSNETSGGFLKLIDYSISNDNMTREKGTPIYHTADCKVGFCAEGTGDDSFIGIQAEFNSVNFWFKLDNNASVQGIASQRFTAVESDGDWDLRWLVGGDGNLNLYHRTSSTNTGCSYRGGIEQDRWYMYTFLNNGTHDVCYLDAEEQNTTVSIDGYGGGINDEPLRLMVQTANAVFENYLNGKIDQFQGWNRALTPSEIQYLYSLNSTILAEENYTAFTTSTTLPVTTTLPFSGIVLEYVSVDCDDINLLITNRTIWNGTAYNEFFNATVCEYNCTETIIGSRCANSPTINGLWTVLFILGGLILILILFEIFKRLFK